VPPSRTDRTPVRSPIQTGTHPRPWPRLTAPASTLRSPERPHRSTAPNDSDSRRSGRAERHLGAREVACPSEQIEALDRHGRTRDRPCAERALPSPVVTMPRPPHLGRRIPGAPAPRDLVDQCSACACPGHAQATRPPRAPSTRRPARNRSSPVTSGPSTPLRTHAYAGVIRPREKAPRNPDLRRRPERETAGQAPVLYARDALTSGSMVAGVHDHRAPLDYKPDITAGHGACPMQPPGRLPYSAHAGIRWSPEKPRPGVRCPQPPVNRRAEVLQSDRHQRGGGRRSAGGPGWRSYASGTAQLARRSMRPPRRSPGLGTWR
jgi:hypothetical protein